MRTIVLTSILASFLLVAGCGDARGKLSGDLVDAAASGDRAEVITLLDEGASPNVHARDDWTPLTIAAREGHADVVQLLLERGASVNLAEGGGHTALFWARKYGHSEVETMLLSAGAKDE